MKLRMGASVLGAAVIGLSVAACGPTLAGSAATIGSSRITDQQLETQVSAVTSGLKIDGSARVSAAILQRMITTQLVAQLAAQNNVTITPAEVDDFITAQIAQMGGKDKFDQQVLQSGIAPQDVKDAVRTTLLVQKLGATLAPGKSEEDQQLATAQAAVKLAQQLNVSVSPRFGTWQPLRLQVGPPPDDLSSTPIDPSKLNPLQGGQQGGQSGGGQTDGADPGANQGADPGAAQ